MAFEGRVDKISRLFWHGNCDLRPAAADGDEDTRGEASVRTVQEIAGNISASFVGPWPLQDCSGSVVALHLCQDRVEGGPLLIGGDDGLTTIAIGASRASGWAKRWSTWHHEELSGSTRQ